jgi:enediyne biosynthesis protein E4
VRDRRFLLLAVIVCAFAIVAGAWLVGPRLLGDASAATGVAPHFVNEADPAGVAHAYTGDFEFYVGGGVAAFDCNSDSLIDLYFAGGSSLAALFTNRSAPGGALAFTQMLSPTTDMDSVTGAYPLDVDGDGITDLAVLRRGGNEMLRGTGDCHFEPANEAWSFDGGSAWSTAFTAKWDAGAQWPTVAVGNYIDESSENTDRLCFDNALHRPADSGPGFAAPTALSPGWCALSMLFSDWDRSGRRDLRVSNDRHYYREIGEGAEQLWNVADDSAPRLYTEADGWRRLRVWGMGIASYDVTGDSYPDYFLTSQADNKLQTLADGPARPTYEDIALRRGALATNPYEGDTKLPSTGWHDQFEDVNNDGLIDLFIAKGNVETMPDFALRDPSNLLIGMPDGTFREGAIDAGIVDFARARGGALVDLNNDGLLDLVVVNRIENVRLWRNVGAGSGESAAPMGHWVAIKLADSGANRDAIGAWLEMKSSDSTQTREVTIGGGHVSGQLAPIHFGIGAQTSAQVRGTWPDGEVGPWMPVRADATYLVTRGATEARPLQ